MEALLFMFDSSALVILIFFSLRNDRRRGGEPQAGPFAYFEDPVAPKPGRERATKRPGSRL